MIARASLFTRLIPVLALAVSLCGGSAHAEDAYAPVEQLLNTGQPGQALQKADDYIAAHPNDPQMRFIRARALQAAGRMDEAEAALTQLTSDSPELAEPWNNLAVLYAARGQLDEARSALQSALRVDPNYATALENLGDIDIRLAMRHYQQARTADPGAGARLSTKIDAAQHVIGSAPTAAQPKTAASGDTPTPPPTATRTRSAP
jgi:tetratricopeptide (TPR) repeat protein